MNDQLQFAIEQYRIRRRLPAPGQRREIRRHAGLSQELAAGAIGVSRPTLSKWENGSSMPRGAALRSYVEFLDLLVALTTTPKNVLDAAGWAAPGEVAEGARHEPG